MIVIDLMKKLPPQYTARPSVNIGRDFEIDVATFERANVAQPLHDDQGGGVATLTETKVYAPTQVSYAIETDYFDNDEYEVRVYDEKRGRRLVAAIEIVSPGNKDREENREAFINKCGGLLKQDVSVTIVDIVTSRSGNLGHELLTELGEPLEADHPDIYAMTIRAIPKLHGHHVEVWEEPLALGKPLPTMPIWLSEKLPFPLELESSYEETCRVLIR